MPWNDSVLAQVAKLAHERGLLKEQDFETLAREAERSRAAPQPPGMTRYELHEALGEGGAAVVYRAWDRQLNRPVALKVLRPAMAEKEGLRHRFEREARAMAGLSHPNVVGVYDAGEAGGQMYLVMELVEGRSLYTILAEHRYEIRPMLHVLEKAARGLAAAHEKGIVHRDVKPSNILVTTGGEPKVADFGLAYLLGSETGLTKTGTALGTPLYMAPEQVRGEQATTRTDVYALGAILYEMLTGRPPHTAETIVEIYARILEEDPLAPRKINRRVPADVETICLRALEKDPMHRYADAREFAEELRRHLVGEPILARPAGPMARTLKWMRRHQPASAVSALALVSLLALGLVTAGNAAVRAREKRVALEGFLEKGRQARERHSQLQAELAGLRDQEKKAAEQILPHDGEPKKLPLWAAQKRVEGKQEEAALTYTDIFVHFTSALGVDPANATARSALANLYFAELERAEATGDRQAAKVNQKLVGLFDDGTYGPRLAHEGTIAIDSNPAGAEVELLRYEEAPDRRLVAKPARRLGRCPLPRMRLDSGSYLLVVRKVGYRDARYPVLVGRGTEHIATVGLYTEEEIGKDFLYVPAGRFVYGGDPAAYQSAPRKEAEVGGFFIGRCEVTTAEYIEFLAHLLRERGVQEAQKRLPRTAQASGHLWQVDTRAILLPRDWKREWPAVGISWEDAHEYCAWRTGRDRKAYRLPTSVEWEKAARGADGRFYPWGDHFDATFTTCALSSADAARHPETVGATEKDESPYGVRDLAGSVREWCEDWQQEPLMRHIRGGTWAFSDPVAFRCATRAGQGPDKPSSFYGLRLVCEPPTR